VFEVILYFGQVRCSGHVGAAEVKRDYVTLQKRSVQISAQFLSSVSHSHLCDCSGHIFDAITKALDFLQVEIQRCGLVFLDSTNIFCIGIG
jgi:hypothetical protein